MPNQSLTLQIIFFNHLFINSVHPVISPKFQASDTTSCLKTLFLLTSTAFQPLVARISNIIGRQPLILAHALSGIGAGGVIIMGPVITNDIIPLRVHGTYQGYINTAVGLGAISGARLGGGLCNMEQVKELDIAGSIALSAAVSFVIIALDLAGRGMSLTILAMLLIRSAGAILKLRSSSDLDTFLMIPNIPVTITGVYSSMLKTVSGNIKPLIIAGASLIVLRSAILYWTDHSVSTLVMASFLIPASMGIGLNTLAISVAILATTCQDDQAIITTTLALWRRLGLLLEVALGSMVYQH
ncbi:hypothetical protein B0T25DRAFT_590520 [Lasiosphaeria hispida]|uniref:Uncharacterized protein n=1 Tax=Lasiosphaeria hispida TaxID=260671 RepID=A0AAJ0HHR6_9PEZI|nr:hypothetical protein B0T25DRAFT_590520 [Lasiosphaeria hispida]